MKQCTFAHKIMSYDSVYFMYVNSPNVMYYHWQKPSRNNDFKCEKFKLKKEHKPRTHCLSWYYVVIKYDVRGNVVPYFWIVNSTHCTSFTFHRVSLKFFLLKWVKITFHETIVEINVKNNMKSEELKYNVKKIDILLIECDFGP